MSFQISSPNKEDIFGITNVTMPVSDESFTTGCGQTECRTADDEGDD